VIWGSQDERRPNPTKGTRPPTTNGQRGISERGERDVGDNSALELARTINI